MIKLAYICFGLGIFGLWHHWYVTGGVFFQWGQFWHHEPLIAMCVSAGVAFLIADFIRRTK